MSRETSRASLSKPVVSTTRPVVAMVVASAPSHGTAPSTRATTSSTVMAQVDRPSVSPTTVARSTATTVAATCCVPLEKVR